MRRLLAIGAALAIVLAAGSASAKHGACVTVSSDVVGGRFSGISLTTLPGSSGGHGIYIHTLQMGQANNTIGARITSAAVLDQDLVTITPTFVFGTGALETVVRQGTAAAGTAEPDYLGQVLQPFQMASIYVPAGKTVTFLQVTISTAAILTVCFTEIE